MNDDFYHVFLASELASKQEIHRFIARFANQQAVDELTVLLADREAVGNTMIAEHVILPHLESPKIKQSQVLFIRLKEPVDLDQATPAVQLVITILLKSGETQAIKQRITQFTRCLADEEFLAQLLTSKNEAAFYQLLETELDKTKK
ncbi:PTS sugar transporter subunit IIA [Enterococcus viikkiensis]|uniref:PTS sugar transporter subunit IIA n=2 Tax=Enterococcus viikkiensis TaxID=930854 RepID=A0ABU3FQK7_9ENTE|nr:PTS sugar transporter subunit IIA [Enterococcus viikkiensis]